MKKLAIILFVLIMQVSVFAQVNVYKPFPQKYGNWWVRTSTYGSTVAGPVYDTLYFTTGDTLVNSLSYKKVNYIYEGIAHGPEPALNQIFTGGTYNFAYRNDSLNKKVYILKAGKTTETLWYNFNLNIGDTLKSYNSPPSQNPFVLIVTSIDSTLLCGNYYKTFLSKCPSGTTTLIERVGFSSNFLGIDHGTNCYFEPNSIPITTAWSLDACPNGLASIKTNNKVSTKLYPNPAQNKITIDATDIVDVKLFDVIGKQITSTNDNNIDVSNLNNGVYFVQVKTNSGTSTQKIIVQH